MWLGLAVRVVGSPFPSSPLFGSEGGWVVGFGHEGGQVIGFGSEGVLVVRVVGFGSEGGRVWW